MPAWTGVPPASITPPTGAEVLTLNPISADGVNFESLTGDQIHFRSFVAPTTGSYHLNTTGHGGLDTVLAVYDSAGTRLAYNDDFGGSRNSDLTVSLRAGSRYYSGVASYYGASSGSYLLYTDGPDDDVNEDNDTLATATNLGAITGPRTLSGLRLLDGGDNFRFQTTTTGTASDFVQINFTHALGDVDLRLYNSAGALVSSSGGVIDSERISLNGLAAGAYTVQVYGYAGATNPNYSLEVNYVADLEDNDFGFLPHTNLGNLSSTFSIQQRLLDWDYFRFAMPGVGTASNFVRVDFTHALGDVDLVLLDANGNTIRRSEGVGNSEVISLDGLAAGNFSVGVYGYNNATNPLYTLTVSPGTSAPTVGSRILNVNFEGATLSRADLIRYSGGAANPFNGVVSGGDWGGFVDQLDSDRNGVSVTRYLNGNANRTAVINRALELLRDDLAGFGISVRLTTGGAVENQSATTVFVGPSTLSNGFRHVAADIDVGNNNRTDIAFVGQELAYVRPNGQYTFSPAGNTFSVEGTALGLADVLLHEAGHTFGLYHVNSYFVGATYPESMGLRYTETNQDNWIRNTSVMDISFAEFSDHGDGAGPQNSFRTMMANFGWGGVVPAGAGLGVSGNLSATQAPTGGGGCCCPLCRGAVAARQSEVEEATAVVARDRSVVSPTQAAVVEARQDSSPRGAARPAAGDSGVGRVEDTGLLVQLARNATAPVQANGVAERTAPLVTVSTFVEVPVIEPGRVSEIRADFASRHHGHHADVSDLIFAELHRDATV